jgi:hypothetical protein
MVIGMMRKRFGLTRNNINGGNILRVIKCVSIRIRKIYILAYEADAFIIYTTARIGTGKVTSGYLISNQIRSQPESTAY